MPRYEDARVPNVPWSGIERSDLYRANDGELELYRDVQIDGHSERHLAMLVIGQYDHSMALCLVAIRCERHGEHLVPLTCSIPETPAAVVREPVATPAQSNPRRRRRDDADFQKGYVE